MRMIGEDIGKKDYIEVVNLQELTCVIYLEKIV